MCDTSYASKRALNAHTKRAHPPTKQTENTDDHRTLINIKTENGVIVPEPVSALVSTEEDVKTEATSGVDSKKNSDEDFMDETPLVIRGQFDCSKCLRSFKCRTSWLKHIEKPHKHNCSTCNRLYVTARDLQDHCCRFKCTICSRGMKSAKALRKHLKLHKNNKRFECAHCGACFQTKVSLCSHIRSRGEHTLPEQQLWCQPCGKRFSSALALKYHTARSHMQGVFLCWKCHKQFDTKEERRAHTQEAHPKQKILFDCPECGKKLSSRGSVKLHVDTVHKKLKPSLCQVRFFSAFCYSFT